MGEVAHGSTKASTKAMVAAVARRPGLWPTAARQGLRLARPGWWRRPPFLPLPDRDYLAFRLETQYGTADAVDGADFVRYVEWCRDQRRSIRHRRRSARR